MSETLHEQSDVIGNPWVSEVRSEVSEVLRSSLEDLCLTLEAIEMSDTNIGDDQIRYLEELAQNVWEGVRGTSNLVEDMALLILNATRTMAKKGSNTEKIQAILAIVQRFQNEELNEGIIADSDRLLTEAGLDIVVEVPGYSGLM